MITTFIILFIIIAYLGYNAITKPQWKAVAQAYYNNKVLLIKYKDYSFTEYHNDNGIWRKAPGMNKVTDQSLSSALTRSAASVTRGGVVKVLRGLY